MSESTRILDPLTSIVSSVPATSLPRLNTFLDLLKEAIEGFSWSHKLPQVHCSVSTSPFYDGDVDIQFLMDKRRLCFWIDKIPESTDDRMYCHFLSHEEKHRAEKRDILSYKADQITVPVLKDLLYYLVEPVL
jgi:hypothetical protein